MKDKIRLGYLASGNGSSVESLINKIKTGELFGFESRVVICNKSDAGIYDRDLGLDVIYAETCEKQLDYLKSFDVDLVLALGFINRIEDPLLSEFKDRILNIHPTLLPKHGGKGMYGLATHMSVLKAEDSQTGATVHLVNSEFDKGKILRQVKVPVPEHLIGKATEDNARELQQYVLQEEYQLMSEVLEKIRDGEIIIGL